LTSDTIQPGVDAHVLAPCPGEALCPKAETDRPCHFPVRAIYPKGLAYLSQETRDGTLHCSFSIGIVGLRMLSDPTPAGFKPVHASKPLFLTLGRPFAYHCPRSCQHNTAGFRSEKISYVVIARGARKDRGQKRIVATPVKRKKHVLFDTCNPVRWLDHASMPPCPYPLWTSHVWVRSGTLCCLFVVLLVA
jgi:hypothetical protein